MGGSELGPPLMCRKNLSKLALSRLLDSVEVENKFIKYPNLGHRFPDDFRFQIDQGLKYILGVK